MLLLAASTTLYGLWAFITLGKLLDSNNDDDDPDDDDGELSNDALNAIVVLFRIWSLCTTIVGAIAARGVLQPHLPSLRIFALHSIIDTSLTALVSLVFVLTLFSSSLSTKLSHSICAHLARSSNSALESVGLIFSPGTGLENCEEKWSFSIVPLLLFFAGTVLFVRAKMTSYVYAWYKDSAYSEGRISLESPSVDSLSSASSATLAHDAHRRYSSSSSGGHNHQHRHHYDRKKSASMSSGSSPPKLRLNSGTNLPLPGRHSRSSSSASTIRPSNGQHHSDPLVPLSPSRIMLLPSDYEGSAVYTSPTSLTPSGTAGHTSPRIPSYCHPNTSAESFETVTAGSSRRRSFSHDPTSNPAGHVVVYAPILMSIEEAQQLGGREAVIASSPNGVSTSTSTKGGLTSPRLRNPSPPVRTSAGYPQPPASEQASVARSTYAEDVKTASPFQSIKGSRQSMDSDPLNTNKSL